MQPLLQNTPRAGNLFVPAGNHRWAVTRFADAHVEKVYKQRWHGSQKTTDFLWLALTLAACLIGLQRQAEIFMQVPTLALCSSYAVVASRGALMLASVLMPVDLYAARREGLIFFDSGVQFCTWFSAIALDYQKTPCGYIYMQLLEAFLSPITASSHLAGSPPLFMLRFSSIAVMMLITFLRRGGACDTCMARVVAASQGKPLNSPFVKGDGDACFTIIRLASTWRSIVMTMSHSHIVRMTSSNASQLNDVPCRGFIVFCVLLIYMRLPFAISIGNDWRSRVAFIKRNLYLLPHDESRREAMALDERGHPPGPTWWLGPNVLIVLCALSVPLSMWP